MTESISDTVTTSAPDLVGVWVFDPLDPEGTERNYLHADSRTESIEPDSSSTQLAGRVNPLLEYGESTVVALKLAIMVPFDDDHDASVQWWRDACDNRRAINYRDGRGRLYWVGLPSGVAPSDQRAGTVFSLVLQRVDFDESVA